jgi:hypothetical protein
MRQPICLPVPAVLQEFPFGHLGSLWSVLVAWGAPGAFAADQALLKPVWMVVCCALELCSGWYTCCATGVAFGLW